jgi:hypothetical protein
MASLEELKKGFIVDEGVIQDRLESLVAEARKHCVIDKKGTVHPNDNSLKSRDKIMLVLAVRYIASQLEPTIKATVTAEEIASSTRLPTDQIRARAADLVRDKLAEPMAKGQWRAQPHKVESFLKSLSSTKPA